MDDLFRCAKVLFAHCPVPPAIRDWDALTDDERFTWVQCYVRMRHIQNEGRREAVLRDLAEARKPTPDPGQERSPEERAVMLAYALAHYARHLDGCAQAPCSCGLAALIELPA
jgi:hypothetical protein